MAFDFGRFHEFSDPVTYADPVIEAVARAIGLGPYTGKFFEAMGAPMLPLTQKTFKVYNRTLTSRDGASSGAWDASATTGLPLSADALKGLTIGHVLLIGTEVVIISAINRSAGTISVHKRGEGGTTAAAHTSGDSFEVIGFAGNDEDLKKVESTNELTEEWENYVQTVFEVVEWTKHAELVRQGMDPANATAMLITEAQTRVARLLSRMAVKGVKAKATGSGGRFMSAGLLTQISDVTGRHARRYNVNGVLTETKFKASLKAMFDEGGNANTIWCNSTVKEYLNAFLGARSEVTLNDNKSNHVAGGLYVTSYDYEGAILTIRVDDAMPGDRIAVVNQAKCKKGWLSDDGLRLVDEPAASSREIRKSLQGSIGFLIEDVGTDHTDLYGITGGSTERIHNVKITNGESDPVSTKEVSA
ncbi:DUF5309 family protein [uncultured Victivallis sp.]|uniref:SU10 major capsid protein n=1 Tax=uncultured Victivallis sp. TaxID=354118 RepID=UPI00259798D3|nr:DUF5309 family protein [uncultured Victivallis sp.]